MIPLKEATGPLKKEVLLREIVPTKVQSDELARLYLRVVRSWRDSAASILAGYNPTLGLVADTVSEVEAEIAAAEARANAIILALQYPVSDWAQRFSSWHSRRFSANVAAGTGVKIDQFLSSQAIAEELRLSLAWNIDLITNVSQSMKQRIANIVWAGWKANLPRAEIARQINRAVGIERKRSLRIAVDQTTKLAGDLDRARMLEAGITDWVWVHSRKAHPREDHVARNGKEYNWISNRPPDVPGELPFCGCKARPLLKW